MNPDMVQFVSDGAARMTPREVEEVVRALPTLRLEWTQISDETYPHLTERMEFLARLVEDFSAGLEKDMPFEAAAEAAFALAYFYREIDIIPDFIPDIGYSDDAQVVNVVLQRHARDFAQYASHTRQQPIDLPGDIL